MLLTIKFSSDDKAQNQQLISFSARKRLSLIITGRKKLFPTITTDLVQVHSTPRLLPRSIADTFSTPHNHGKLENRVPSQKL